MSMLETASKGTLFAVGISCITAGIKIVEDNLQAGIVLLAVGIGLVILWAVLVHKQSKEAGEKAARKFLEEALKKYEFREKGYVGKNDS